MRSGCLFFFHTRIQLLILNHTSTRNVKFRLPDKVNTEYYNKTRKKVQVCRPDFPYEMSIFNQNILLKGAVQMEPGDWDLSQRTCCGNFLGDVPYPLTPGRMRAQAEAGLSHAVAV
ncbi:hypothetical protein B4135_0384 [Caldibacillus debilis]|uniref:Uncharacterized protein n=1 Tax=Caldibacillus debilis TaxID=301148 RepID=A0A150LKJ8_9BACI|nr:hypothetical protein B4135_0384 [Caldibacillus debilis]